MSKEENRPPPGGLGLSAAIEAFADPKLLKAHLEAIDRVHADPPWLRRGWGENWDPDPAKERIAARYRRQRAAANQAREGASRAVLQDIWSQHRLGTLVAWGREGSAIGAWRKIPADSFDLLLVRSYSKSILKGPDGLRIYSVLIYRVDDDASARRIGRPSREVEIRNARDELFEEGKIDLGMSQKKAIEAVRARVLESAGDDDDTGLQNEAIRKHVAPRFRRERAKR